MSDQYLSGSYATQNPTWHDEDAPHKSSAIVAFLKGAGQCPSSIVDVGCGAGGVLSGISAAFPDATCEGWDIAPEAIRRARKREHKQLTFVRGDFLATPRRVDLALCVDVLEHVADDVGFLVRLAERARVVLLRLPLDLSAWDVLRPRRRLEARRRFGHVHAYDRAAAQQIIADAGLMTMTERYDRIAPEVSGLAGVSDLVRRALVRSAPHLGVRLLGGYSWLVLARPRVDSGPKEAP